MKTITTLLLFVTLFTSGQDAPAGKGATSSNADFASPFVSLVLPYTYRGIIPYIGTDKKLSNQWIDSLPHDKTMLDSFNSIESSVTVVDITSNLSGSYTVASVTADNSNYLVMYDHIIGTTILTETTNHSDSRYNAFVGVTVRLVAIINSKKKGVKITNLFNLGLAAEKKNINGKLQVQVFGCNSQKIQAIIPITSDLNPTSIEQALQAVATIKSLVHDTTTIINPCVLGFVKLNNGNEGIDQLKFIEAEDKSTNIKRSR